MSNYTKSTNFATKDNLPTGDPLKIVKGTEIDTEFNNIATAISTKTDNASAAITGGSITGITDLAIADGGTGASTATAAINNLLPSQTSNANKYLQTDGTNVSWDAVSLSTSDITGTLPIANGGTGTTSTTFANLTTNVTGTLPVANGGTGVTSSTGTGSNVLSDSPTLVTPALGTPASATLTNATGLPISTGVSGLGTGVATALGINTPNIGAIVVNGGALGTPSSGTVTNLTGTANININGMVGNTTAYSGAFTSLTTSSTVTINGGTANGIGYLNGSKVFTTGTVLKFDGLNFISDRSTSTVYSGTNQATWANGIVLNNSATPATGIFDSIYFSNNANMINVFGVAQNASGYGDFVWAGYAGTYTEWMKLTSSGLTLTSNPTLSGGTANGVTYLNGSKVLTSGSALTFDGTTFKVAKAGGVFGPTNLVYVDVTSSYGGVTLNSASGQNCFFELYQGGTTKVGEFGIDAANSLVNIGGFGSYNTRFYASGSEQMRLTSTGLGIGTSSPAYKLDVNGSANITSYLRIGSTPATGGDIRLPNTGIIAGRNAANSSNRVMLQLDSSDSVLLQEGSVTINSAGNLGLGVTPSAWATSYKAFQFGVGGSLARTGAGAGDVTLTTNAYYDSTNSRWQFIYTGDYAARYSMTGAGIHSWYTSTASGTAGNAISFTQAMSLLSSGAWVLGDTSTVASGFAGVKFNGASFNGLGLNDSSATSGAGYVYFQSNGTTIGSITRVASTSAVAYNTTSDQRLKNDLGVVKSTDVIANTVIHDFTWKSDGSQARGVFAQEAAKTLPSAVKVGDDGEEVTDQWQVDYSKYVPDIIVELQALRARVAELETK